VLRTQKNDPQSPPHINWSSFGNRSGLCLSTASGKPLSITSIPLRKLTIFLPHYLCSGCEPILILLHNQYSRDNETLFFKISSSAKKRNPPFELIVLSKTQKQYSLVLNTPTRRLSERHWQNFCEIQRIWNTVSTVTEIDEAIKKRILRTLTTMWNLKNA
jgi:hypothetical protein